MALETNLTLSASASGALPVHLVLARRGKVAVFDDGTGAEVLSNALAKLGFEVDYYPENYQVVRYVDPASGSSEIRYSVRHSWDDALVFKYDAVVAVLTGADGSGRLLIDPEAKAYAEGMHLIYRQFLKNMEEAGVKPMDCQGQPFDPNFHNAVMHVEDENLGENVIAEEFQKGYLYKDSVLRHSMVKVAN